MGYYTFYELETDAEQDIHDEIITVLRENSDGAEYALNEFGEGADSTKWYSHNVDMLNISKLYPDVLFTLSGTGEENGDIWKKYYKNGKMQEVTAKITYDRFDESKLQ